MTILELKAEAYDTLAQINYLNERLGRIHREIAERSRNEKEAENTHGISTDNGSSATH